MVKTGGVAIILVALMASLPTPVKSQAEPQPEPQSAESVGSRRSPVLAGALEYFIPTIGHAYAGDWKRGIGSNIVRIGGVILVAIEQQGSEGVLPSDSGCAEMCLIGVGVAAVGTAWAIWSAVKTANDFNNERSTAPLTLTLSPTPDGGFLIGGQIRPRRPSLKPH